MDDLYLDSENRFLKPDFDNNTITALGTILRKMDFISAPKLEVKNNSNVERIWKERGKQEKVQNIVFLIADSLGTANIRETGILKDYLEKNLELDTSFPTMTSTNMASLSHIQYPSTHGLVGYNIYHEKVNGIFNSLNCMTMVNGKETSINKYATKQDVIAGENISSILEHQANICMQELYYETWIPENFDLQGLPAYLFGINTPIYTYASFSPKKMLQELYHHLFNSRALNLISIYFPHTDVSSHLYSAQSKEYYVSMKLLEEIIMALERHPTVSMGETAVVVTSDHGQCRLPKGSQNIKVLPSDVKDHNKQGFFIGTSGRTLHVYYSNETGQRNAENYLEKYFANGKNGIILDQQEALKLLGPVKPSKLITNRLGQKVVLFDENFYLDYPEVVVYGEGKELQAQHGGLSRNELKVPFLII